MKQMQPRQGNLSNTLSGHDSSHNLKSSPTPHFNTLSVRLLSYGVFLAASLHFTNGTVILNILWEAHYPDDLAASALSICISLILCSLLHPLLSLKKYWEVTAESLSLFLIENPSGYSPSWSHHNQISLQDGINVCYCPHAVIHPNTVLADRPHWGHEEWLWSHKWEKKSRSSS